MTRLKAIKGISITKIGMRQLCLFANKVGIKGMRNKQKCDVCAAIVESITTGGWKKMKATTEAKEKKKAYLKRSVTINRRRLLNVVFLDTVRPQLSNLGVALSRAEVDAGRKTDQVFHELVASEYNKTHVVEYGENTFPLLQVGRAQPPSHFQEIDWEKSKESWKSMCNEYEFCFKNWKHSGFHDKDIPTDILEMVKVCKQPFDSYANNSSSILYMHEFVVQYPGILDAVTGT